MSWLLPDWQKTVVFIGQETGDKKNFIGTGVLLNVSNIFCLSTAKHVVYDKDNKRFRENLFVSFNSKDGKILDRKIEDIKRTFNVEWISHNNEEVDIAIIPFGLDIEKDDVKTIPENLFIRFNEINVADEIFFLGFQPGLSLTRVKPIVRAGIISRLEDDKTFYIDTSAFPGNSGSPVFLKPSPISFRKEGINIGTTHMGKLIGIIGEYVPYQEYAVSSQTGRPRIMFEENTGISRVWSIDCINDILSSDKLTEQLRKLKGGGAVNDRHKSQ